jgi:AraC-like DNA-binding protein
MSDVHPGYLARAFRQHVGCSIGAYLRHLRLQRAIARLPGADETLSRISLESGFSDQPHFTRAFRRDVGMTPASLRRMALKNGIGCA